MLEYLTLWNAAIVGTLLYGIRCFIETFSVSNVTTRSMLITGCDSGFGHLLARRLAREGMPVFAACLTHNAATELSKLPNMDAFVMDVTSDESVTAAVAHVEEALHGRGLWALVNNAGILGPVTPDDWLTVQHYEVAFAVNALGLIRVTHGFMHLIKKARGRVVNAASIAGRLSFPSSGPYNVSKYAVESYSDTLRLEMAAFDVSVHMLEPGFFKTGLLDTARTEAETKSIYDACSDRTKADYGEAFFKDMQVKRSEKMTKWANSDISLVVEAYHSAITSVWPRARYSVGNDAKYLWAPMSMMPSIVQDAFFRLLVRLSGQVKPAAVVRLGK